MLTLYDIITSQIFTESSPPKFKKEKNHEDFLQYDNLDVTGNRIVIFFIEQAAQILSNSYY